MTTPPILSDTEIEARIASVARSLSVPLTQADIAWIAENGRHWLKPDSGPAVHGKLRMTRRTVRLAGRAGVRGGRPRCGRVDPTFKIALKSDQRNQRANKNNADLCDKDITIRSFH